MILLPAQTTPASPVVGDRAPDVAFRRPDGSTVKLSSFRGKIVVLEFTAYVCAPCRLLAPKLEALAERTPDVVFLTVCADGPGEVAKLLEERPKAAKTIFLQDPRQDDRSKMSIWRFGNLGFPNMFVIGRNGTMASRYMMGGVDDLPRLEERIAWARRRT